MLHNPVYHQHLHISLFGVVISNAGIIYVATIETLVGTMSKFTIDMIPIQGILKE